MQGNLNHSVLDTFSLPLGSLLLLGAAVLGSACEGDVAGPSTLPPRMVVRPDQIDFGEVPLNIGVANRVRVSNSGSETLKVSAVVLEGDATVFEVIPAAFELEEGESQQLSITFTPERIRAYQGQLSFVSNAESGGDSQVEILGEGIDAFICGDCSTPPAAYCVSEDALIAYERNGTCDDGQCRYEAVYRACQGLCDVQAGACSSEADAGPADGGSPPVDATVALDAGFPDGGGDAAANDLGQPDLGGPDGAIVDSGATDTGQADAAVVDGPVPDTQVAQDAAQVDPDASGSGDAGSLDATTPTDAAAATDAAPVCDGAGCSSCVDTCTTEGASCGVATGVLEVCVVTAQGCLVKYLQACPYGCQDTACMPPPATCAIDQCTPVTPTEQVLCADASAEMTCTGMPCSGQDYCGQDAQYADPPRQFVCYGASGEIQSPCDGAAGDDEVVVVDSLTGLMWQRSSTTGTWSTAQQTCADLSYGGFDDWTLPTPHELVGLLELSLPTPTIDTSAFPGTAATDYWTALQYGASGARTVGFAGGSVAIWTDSQQKGIRCVRGRVGDGDRGARFEEQLVAGSTVVVDGVTELIWGDGADGLSWREALQFCEQSQHADLDDWRLPNYKELFSLFSFEHISPTSDFPGWPADGFFWSSTSEVSTASEAWVGYFRTGYMSSYDKGSAYSARCVRDPGGPGIADAGVGDSAPLDAGAADVQVEDAGAVDIISVDAGPNGTCPGDLDSDAIDLDDNGVPDRDETLVCNSQFNYGSDSWQVVSGTVSVSDGVVTASSTSGNVGALGQCILVQPNATYTIWINVRKITADGYSGYGAEVFASEDCSGERLTATFHGTSPGSSWIVLHGDRATPAGSASMLISLRSYTGSGSSTSQFDNVLVRIK